VNINNFYAIYQPLTRYSNRFHHDDKDFNRKNHWYNIYNTKDIQYLSRYQQFPITSLNFLKQFAVPITGKIIDIE
jgi:hypothetical protein